MDEIVLIAQSRAGEIDAYDRLVGIYQDRIYQLTYRITGNREDAWDAAQEAFLKAYRSIKAFRGKSAFSTWLHRIALNAALDIVRRRPQPFQPPLEDVEGEAGDPGEEIERRDVRRQVHHAIASLPVDHRVAVVLRDLHGLAYEEIAGMLKVPIGTVRSRLSRGRETLRVMLADLAPAAGPVGGMDRGGRGR